MKNYKTSDYAANKYADGIVYRFNGQTVEVTLEAYLAENPGHTEQDFHRFKALSDSMFHEQDISDNAHGRHSAPLYDDTDEAAFASPTLEDDYEERLDKQAVRKATMRLLASGELTETQERRFRMYYFKGLSLRQIAERENVHFTSVSESVTAATDKLKKFFKKT